MIRKTTPTGITRPATGQFPDFATARTVAKAYNMSRGRGHRAIRAHRDGYAVIFRPAVANNKQRRVRSF